MRRSGQLSELEILDKNRQLTYVLMVPLLGLMVVLTVLFTSWGDVNLLWFIAFLSFSAILGLSYRLVKLTPYTIPANLSKLMFAMTLLAPLLSLRGLRGFVVGELPPMGLEAIVLTMAYTYLTIAALLFISSKLPPSVRERFPKRTEEDIKKMTPLSLGFAVTIIAVLVSIVGMNTLLILISIAAGGIIFYLGSRKFVVGKTNKMQSKEITPTIIKGTVLFAPLAIAWAIITAILNLPEIVLLLGVLLIILIYTWWLWRRLN